MRDITHHTQELMSQNHSMFITRGSTVCLLNPVHVHRWIQVKCELYLCVLFVILKRKYKER